MQKENFPETYAPGEEPVALKASNAAAPRRGLRRPLGLRGSSCRWSSSRCSTSSPASSRSERADGSVYGLQIWLKTHIGRYFESTLLQELEWHLHTALFALVLGFGTIYNTHVRVDLIRDTCSFRKKIWIEFLGLTFFMIPYLLAGDLFRLELGGGVPTRWARSRPPPSA